MQPRGLISPHARNVDLIVAHASFGDPDTPHYMVIAETPHRIADMYGGRDSGLKFVVTLREPASRAISSWEFKNEFNPKKGRKSSLYYSILFCFDFVVFNRLCETAIWASGRWCVKPNTVLCSLYSLLHNTAFKSWCFCAIYHTYVVGR